MGTPILDQHRIVVWSSDLMASACSSLLASASQAMCPFNLALTLWGTFGLSGINLCCLLTFHYWKTSRKIRRKCGYVWKKGKKKKKQDKQNTAQLLSFHNIILRSVQTSQLSQIFPERFIVSKMYSITFCVWKMRGHALPDTFVLRSTCLSH